jgi:FAD-linked oxidoreductase
VRNWARNEACVPSRYERPGSIDEVAAVVAAAQRERRRVKAIGAGHSFTPAAMTSGVLVSLDRMGSVRHVDRARGRVTVDAGITLRALADELTLVGLAMPNLGDINVQSIAGATSTATHGTGRALGNLATTIVGIELVGGNGQIVQCDEHNDPELLRVARVGLGALGVVAGLTLQCVPAFNLRAHETIEPLDDILADVDAFARSADHTEFYWMPGSTRCQVKRNQRTDAPPRPQSRVAYVRDKYLAENVGLGLICRVGRRFPSLTPSIARLVAAGMSERELIDRSDRVFTSPRHVRFVEMEYGVPLTRLAEVVDRVRHLTNTLDHPPLFPIEVRVSAADDIPLSTGYGRENGWVAVHQYRGAPYERYFHGVETIMNECEGRPHWGKLHFQTAATLQERYPEWDAFTRQRAHLDPDGTFRNDYLDRVLGSIAI